MSNPDLSPADFWQFSCRCYGHRDIALHALSLQDSHAVNVNMLLFLCWCLDNRVVLSLEQFKQLKAAIRESETVLAAHRDKRRATHPDNGGNSDKYETLKAQELELERVQQQALVTRFQFLDNVTQLPSETGKAVLNASMAAFIHCYQLKNDTPARHHIGAIVNQLASL